MGGFENLETPLALCLVPCFRIPLPLPQGLIANGAWKVWIWVVTVPERLQVFVESWEAASRSNVELIKQSQLKGSTYRPLATRIYRAVIDGVSGLGLSPGTLSCLSPDDGTDVK